MTSSPGYGGRPREDGGTTLIEALLAVTIGAIVFSAAIQFYRMGSQSVVKTSDHAQARIEAMRVLDAIREDLDRLVVDDDIRHLVIPVTIKPDGSQIRFLAFHHREYSKTATEMTLIARPIVYSTVPVPGGMGGVYVMRNGKRLGEGLGTVGPVTKLIFQPLSKQQACELHISPYHAIWAKVYPRGAWDSLNKALASEASVQSRLMHLAHIESQYAVMMTIKKSGPPPGVFTNLDQLDDPLQNCPQKIENPSIPLDWVRPLGLVKYDENTPFDDDSSDVDIPLP